MRKPELRLKTWRGSDRGVKYARTTDKGDSKSLRYSLLCNYNAIREVAANKRFIFPWAQKNAPITVTGLDKLKNMGQAQVIDHVKSEIQASEEDIKDSFATGFYSAGTDTKEIVGARVWLSVSNTYGGISQTSNSWAQIGPSCRGTC